MKDIRKLTLLSLGFSAAVLAAHYLLPIEYLYITAAVTELFAGASFLLRGKKRKILFLLFFSMSLGFIGYRLHYDNTVAVYNTYDGETVTAELELIGYPKTTQYGSSVEVRLSVDELEDVKSVIYLDDGKLSDAKPGDRIKAELKLNSAALKAGANYDSKIADGIYFTASLKSPYQTLEPNGKSLKYLPQRVGKLVRDGIRDVFPAETQGFMLALLSGDKSEYYLDDALYSSMNTSGLAHVVAVSGMHVSFLVAFLTLTLGSSRKTSWLCLAVVWFFVIMSGSSPSAVRAGIMISLSLLAPVFKRENDRTTSLSFALALILIPNPFAVASASLQLSFAAMAGIFLFSERIYGYVDAHTPGFKKAKRLKMYLNGAFSNSIAVTALSMPVTAFRFGTVALLSPLSNMLCIWAVSLLFTVSFAAVLLGFVFLPLGKLLGGIMAYLAKYIFAVTGFIAKIPFASLYTDNLYAAAWIVLVYIIFIISYFCREKDKKFKPLLPTVLSLAALVSVFVWSTAAYKADKGTAAILDVGNGQCIVLTQGEHSAVIDCGGYKAGVNAGNEASNYLHSLGRTKLDCLFLTRVNTEHCSGAVRLLNVIEVGTLYLPSDALEKADKALLEKLMSTAEDCGTELVFVDGEREIRLGGIGLSVYEPLDKKAELCLTARVGEKNILITSDSSKTSELKLAGKYELQDTDILIVGQRGSKSVASDELLIETNPELAVISVGNDIFGRPARELLYRLESYHIKILRTDRNGTIIISAGG